MVVQAGVVWDGVEGAGGAGFGVVRGVDEAGLYAGAGDRAAPLMAVSLGILQAIGSANAQQVLPSLSHVSRELGYDQARFDKLLAEAVEAYKRDGGRSVIEAAFAGLDVGGDGGQD